MKTIDETLKILNERTRKHCNKCGSKVLVQIIPSENMPDPYGTIFFKEKFPSFNEQGEKLYGIKIICPNKGGIFSKHESGFVGGFGNYVNTLDGLIKKSDNV